MATAKIETKTEPARYTKAQLMGAKRYQSQVDVLNVVLDDYSLYTTGDAEKRMNDFLKGKVK